MVWQLRNVYACQIPISLPSCQSLKPAAIFESNTTNLPDLLSNNNKEDIDPRPSYNGNKKIRQRPADIICNNNRNIDSERPSTLDWISWNGLLSKSSENFWEVTFGDSKYLVSTPVLNNEYEYPGSFIYYWQDLIMYWPTILKNQRLSNAILIIFYLIHW